MVESRPERTDDSISRRGTGLLIPGTALAVAGFVLFAVRLILGETAPLGLVSSVLIAVSGVVIAWRSWRTRRRHRGDADASN